MLYFLAEGSFIVVVRLYYEVYFCSTVIPYKYCISQEKALDAIHDTVHEMAGDEARHGKAFEGLSLSLEKHTSLNVGLKKR